MDKKFETTLRVLMTEFRNIKESLEPILKEVKQMESLRIELKNLKEEFDAKIKKLEFENRKLQGEKAGTSVGKEFAHRLERLNSSLTSRLDETTKHVRDIETRLKKEVSRSESEDTHFQKSIKVEDKELKSIVNKELKKNITEIDEKHMNLISTTRNKTADVISDLAQLKIETSKNTEELRRIEGELNNKQESTSNRFNDFEKWFREQDKYSTKQLNLRKRHINQIVEEINNLRKLMHENKNLIVLNKEKFDEQVNKHIELSNDVSKLKTLDQTKADVKKITDVQLGYNRLEKKTVSDVGEIKARMIELERRLLSKKDVDKIQTSIQKLQADKIKQIEDSLNKFQELDKLTENLSRMMKYTELLKKTAEHHGIQIAELTKTASTKELELVKMSMDSLKKEIDSINIKVENTSKILKELEQVL
jgi:hypothetical protein